MNTKTGANRGKFAEPRSWAAKWCGHGLAAADNRPPVTQSVTKTFATPRAWSAQWCGRGLALKAHWPPTERPTD